MKTLATLRVVSEQPTRWDGRVHLFQLALWSARHGFSRIACAILALLRKHFRPFRDPLLQSIVNLGTFSHLITTGTDPDDIAKQLLKKQIA